MDLDNNLEVSTHNLSKNPKCEHGPMLLFKTKTQEYYACSAFRNRKLCPAYLSKNDYLKNSSKFRKVRFQNESFVDKNKFYRVKNLKSRCDVLSYCKICQILTNNIDDHSGHDLIKNLTKKQLKTPSKILPPYQNNKSNAQYYFNEESLNEITNILIQLSFKRIICIGTPRIYEFFRNNRKIGIEVFLLDFDERFYSFYLSKYFCRFNMFNYYFFDKIGRKNFYNFIRNFDEPSKFAVILDPPFGGRTEPLIYTLKRIQKLFGKFHNDASLNVFWIFPYFMEKFIKIFDNNFTMLPLKICYENHRKFRNSHGKYGSPIRIFTNINQSLLSLQSTTTKYCKLCQKFVFKNAKHCNQCAKCSFENGSIYRHCSACKKCVKSSWIHCKQCSFCHLIDKCIKTVQ